MMMMMMIWFCLLMSFITKGSSLKALSWDCQNTTSYTPKSTYKANLNSLLSNLYSNATRDNGFYHATVAGSRSNDTVHGLFLCRGDVSTDDCRSCIGEARTKILELCTNETTGIVWYDNCLLRYSEKSMLGILDQSTWYQMSNPKNETQVPNQFMELVGNMFDQIITPVSSGSGKKFAVLQTNFSVAGTLFFETVYVLGQCTPDLSNVECQICLRYAINELPFCCYGALGARAVYPSCNVRYELYAFYNVSAAAVASPAPPPIHPPAPPLLPSVFPNSTTSKGMTEIPIEESVQYDFGTIQAITNCFSPENKIGEGGCSSVYKGRFPNGQEVAVKRLSRSSRQGAVEFKNEVALVAKLLHRNLVKLLGFCLQGEEKILVYEFVPNKSLDYFLFDPEKKRLLNWSTRFKIIVGIARGLLYLHEDSRLKIIHRDLKASNMLLDGDMNSKISDFGLARIFMADQTQGNTNRIIGTYGYMSPEYVKHGLFSVKSDVFSFGVILLEIITGKRNSSLSMKSTGAKDLLSYAWKHWSEERALDIVDQSLRGLYSRDEVIQCINVGLLCVQEDVDERPTMANVLLMLNSFSATRRTPSNPPAFFNGGIERISFGETVDQSINEVSISDLYPR
ncbi:cysteine-rich receptor-like protein kinase 25 isoform X2 [Ipomoea triloba]|uniref:cysteine-rich receptor-like protein kinase 25 isoform X2 n=1 Tax=Ipomoea triloba TaxID=35885 RepID=UPI00125D25C8|nr:cysteine-rich receptor-like protein kinase 25 isoform X2 [Ipomoea triloba]